MSEHKHNWIANEVFRVTEPDESTTVVIVLYECEEQSCYETAWSRGEIQ